MKCIKTNDDSIHEIVTFNGYPVVQMGQWPYREDYPATMVCGLSHQQQMDRVEEFVSREYDRKIRLFQQLNLFDEKLFILIYWEKKFYSYKIPWRNTFSMGRAPLFEKCGDSCFGGETLLVDLCKDWVKRIRTQGDEEKKKIPMLKGLKPVPTCERCGGTINLSTMSCEYCNTKYYAEGVF